MGLIKDLIPVAVIGGIAIVVWVYRDDITGFISGLGGEGEITEEGDMVGGEEIPTEGGAVDEDAAPMSGDEAEGAPTDPLEQLKAQAQEVLASMGIGEGSPEMTTVTDPGTGRQMRVPRERPVRAPRPVRTPRTRPVRSGGGSVASPGPDLIESARQLIADLLNRANSIISGRRQAKSPSRTTSKTPTPTTRQTPTRASRPVRQSRSTPVRRAPVKAPTKTVTKSRPVVTTYTPTKATTKTVTTTTSTCQSGYYLSAGRCRRIPNCRQGMTFNPNTGMCEGTRQRSRYAALRAKGRLHYG